MSVKENLVYDDKNFAETGNDTPVTSEEIKEAALFSIFIL